MALLLTEKEKPFSEMETGRKWNLAFKLKGKLLVLSSTIGC
jgi:hypothetical protein